MVLTFVILVRSSAGYLLGFILLGVCFKVWINRFNPAVLREVLGKVGVVMVVGAALSSAIVASVPAYVESGRFLGNFWHRAFVSFGVHEEWPFGNLREVYDCSDVFPGGLTRDLPDRDAHCVFWSTYPPAVAGKLTEADVDQFLFGPVYEKLMRAAFFNVVFSYPEKMLELYLYYKSNAIFETLRRAVHFDWRAYTITGLALAGLQCVVFVSFVVWAGPRRTSELAPFAGIVFVLFLLSLLPLYVAWSNLSTSVDTIALVYAGAAIGMSGFLLMIFRKGPSVASQEESPPQWTRVHFSHVRFGALLLSGFSIALMSILIGFWVGRHVFDDGGQQVTFGGAEASPGQAVPGSIPTRGTELGELPLLSASSSQSGRWDLIEGLKADVVEGPMVIAGQRVLRLVAVGSDNHHQLGASFGGLAAGHTYRAIAWIKAEPDLRVMIEARDGGQSSYGVVRADLAARAIVGSRGDRLASGVEGAGGDWVKVWVDLHSGDGEVVVKIALLASRANKSVFTATGQQVTFGGVEVLPR
jgi:hypothetical protein